MNVQRVQKLYERVKNELNNMNEESFTMALEHRLRCIEQSSEYQWGLAVRNTIEGSIKRATEGACPFCGSTSIKLDERKGMLVCTLCGRIIADSLAMGGERKLKDDDDKQQNLGTNAMSNDPYMYDQSGTLVSTDRRLNVSSIEQDRFASQIRSAMTMNRIPTELGVKGARHLHHMVDIFCKENHISHSDNMVIRLMFEDLIPWIIYALRYLHDPSLD